MALTLTLDYAEKVIKEPGFHTHISAEEALKKSQVDSPADTPGLWQAPDTGVVMLRPQQLSPHWLNSADQIASIIRAADMVFSPTDVSNKTVFEEFAFGNPDNFYIYHSPAAFPGSPSAMPPMPGAPPSLVGAPYGGNLSAGLTTISDETDVPFNTYSAPASPVGSVADGRLIAYTKEVQPANACFYFRWFAPNPKAGHFTRHIFFVAQFALEIIGNMVILHQDVSTAGDRSSYGRIWAKPMFGPDTFSPGNSYSFFGTMPTAEGNEGDRSLLFIPYFRNRVLLMASSGTAYSPKVKETPVLAPTGSANTWDITRADTLGVWSLTPAPGRFQVQKVRFANGPATLDLPHTMIDYTPAAPPTVSLFKDADHGTAIGGTVSQPPGYTLRFNDLNACPPPTTMTGDQSLNYGISLTFTGEGTHRWTPFFYGLTFDSPTTLQNSVTTPATVVATGTPTTNIQAAMVAWGDKPGDGRMEVTVIDESAYSLAPYYYRSEIPVQLITDGVTCFTGLTDQHEVTPLHETARPRVVKIPAMDRWKQLAHYTLRDQATKSGLGHISVVLNIAAQAGIDTSTAETPPLNNTYNTKLGLLDSTIPRTEAETKLIRDFWKPLDDDTAASYILRVVERFSNWDVGFRPDGKFFYLPQDWFTTTALRFFHSAAARTAAGVGFENNPLVRDVVELEPQPPEANAVQVIAASDKQGNVLRSSIWIDWASIKNPAAVNFLGRWKPTAIVVPYAVSCEELNRIARVVFDAVRRRRRRVSFESDFVPTLKIGQIMEVGTYGLYRLKRVKSELIRGNWAPTNYEGELVESGFGL